MQLRSTNDFFAPDSLESHSGSVRRGKFTRMWWIATGALLAVALLFVLSLVMIEQGSCMWWQAVKSFSEAALVGAMADWFAVVALFRHPMGIPIPHTAVLVNNKPRVAESIASFFAESFWLPSLVREKVMKVAPVNLLLKGLQAGDSVLSSRLRTTVLEEIVPMLREPGIRADLSDKLHLFIERLPLEKTAAGLIQGAADSGLPQRVTALLAEETAHFVSDNRQDLAAELSRNLPLPAVLSDSMVGRLVGDSFAVTLAPLVIGKLESYMRCVQADPSHPLRLKVQEKLAEMMRDSSPDSQLLRTLAEVKSAVLRPESLRNLVDMIGNEVASWMDDSVLARDGLTALVLDFMEKNPPLAAKLDAVVADVAAASVEQTRDFVKAELRQTVMNWDMDTMIAKIEEQVGSDLQFIRLNGTIVGGIIGLLIFGITSCFN